MTALLLAVLTAGATHAQTERSADIHVGNGSLRHLLGHWTPDGLTLVSACVPAPVPADADTLTLSTPPGVDVLRPRQLAPGSEEWNRVTPALLTLAGRREREQRLAPGAPARGTRFVDWLFAADVGGRTIYYFETSRRVPSPPADANDADADPPSTLRVVVSGFARVNAADAIPLGTKAELRWEEDGRPRGPQRPDLRPLGILGAAEPVWIMEDRMPSSSTIRAFSLGPRGTSAIGATRIGRC